MTNTQAHKKDTTVRVPQDLIEQMKVIAKAHDRSLVAEVRVALDAYAKQHANKEA